MPAIKKDAVMVRVTGEVGGNDFDLYFCMGCVKKGNVFPDDRFGGAEISDFSEEELQQIPNEIIICDYCGKIISGMDKN